MNAKLKLEIDEAALRGLVEDIINAIDEISERDESDLQQKQFPDLNAQQFLSIEEMCKLFKVSRVTINSWMKQGKIPFRKITRRVYFNIDEIIGNSPKYNLKSVHSFQKALKNNELNSSI